MDWIEEANARDGHWYFEVCLFLFSNRAKFLIDGLSDVLDLLRKRASFGAAGRDGFNNHCQFFIVRIGDDDMVVLIGFFLMSVRTAFIR